jgi:tetratricopeptide (TPR) repeat protein
VLGEEHPDTIGTMGNLAALYAKQGKYAQAEPLSLKTLEVRRRVLGDEHPDTLRSMNNLGLLYVDSGKHAEAESLLRAALTSYLKTSPDSWERYNCESLLGASLIGQKKYREAEPLVTGGYEALVQRKTKMPAGSSTTLAEAGQRIVRLYKEWGPAEKAASWAKTVEGSAKR